MAKLWPLIISLYKGHICYVFMYVCMCVCVCVHAYICMVPLMHAYA